MDKVLKHSAQGEASSIQGESSSWGCQEDFLERQLSQVFKTVVSAADGTGKDEREVCGVCRGGQEGAAGVDRVRRTAQCLPCLQLELGTASLQPSPLPTWHIPQAP